MSNWRDTVMSDIQSEDLMDRNSAHPIKTQVRLVKKAQAEISFKMGYNQALKDIKGGLSPSDMV